MYRVSLILALASLVTSRSDAGLVTVDFESPDLTEGTSAGNQFSGLVFGSSGFVAEPGGASPTAFTVNGVGNDSLAGGSSAVIGTQFITDDPTSGPFQPSVVRWDILRGANERVVDFSFDLIDFESVTDMSGTTNERVRVRLFDTSNVEIFNQRWTADVDTLPGMQSAGDGSIIRFSFSGFNDIGGASVLVDSVGSGAPLAGFAIDNFEWNVTPEPSALAFLSLSSLGLCFVRRRRQSV